MDTFVIAGIDELNEQILGLKASNPRFMAQQKKLLAEAIKVAKKEVTSAARSALSNDPRKAYMAVRSAVWKRALGGNVNILQSRKANSKQYAGGNIGAKGATSRTRALAGYYGSDRGFVLRFLNAGTADRAVKGINGHSVRRSSESERRPKGKQMGRAYRVRMYKGGIGNRGSIPARNWFKAPAEASMQHAAEVYAALCERAIAEVWNEK